MKDNHIQQGQIPYGVHLLNSLSVQLSSLKFRRAGVVIGVSPVSFVPAGLAETIGYNWRWVILPPAN